MYRYYALGICFSNLVILLLLFPLPIANAQLTRYHDICMHYLMNG